MRIYRLPGRNFQLKLQGGTTVVHPLIMGVLVVTNSAALVINEGTSISAFSSSTPLSTSHRVCFTYSPSNRSPIALASLPPKHCALPQLSRRASKLNPVSCNSGGGETMKEELTQVMHKVAVASLDGEMTFPEVVGQLDAIGVERYHTDYSRQEVTYYLADGDSYVVASPHSPHATGMEFSSELVEAAVRQSQRNEHTYVDFVRKTMEAGCVGYFVQITGRRAIYFGRNGDIHVEHFPSAPVAKQLAPMEGPDQHDLAKI